MEKITCTALALEFTKSEEIGAVRSTVAWAMAAMDIVLGWTVPAPKGMDKKTAIKTLRETHGYRKDSAGQPILDSKGNRAKRSAVFSRLALVEKVLAYMVKTTPAFVTELHVAALSGDFDRMQETVCAIGASLAAMAGDDTLDALAYFLDHGKAKPAKVQDALAALAGGDDAAKPEPVTKDSGIGDVLAWFAKHKTELSDSQLDSLIAAVTAEKVQRLEIAAQDAADLVAGAAGLIAMAKAADLEQEKAAA